MKVTVCFGDTKLVVPCGKGNFTIRELIDKAVQRYRTAISKNTDYSVAIRNVTLARDGGILDWSDNVDDVLDDKELVLVQFYDTVNHVTSAASHQETAGSCHSAANVLTADCSTKNNVKAKPFALRNSRTSPALELHLDQSGASASDIEPSPGSGPRSAMLASTLEDDYPKLAHKYFVRNCSGQSSSSCNSGLLRWLDTHEMLLGKRAGSPDTSSKEESNLSVAWSLTDHEDNLLLVINNEDAAPLGIKLTPFVSPASNEILGLEVQQICSDGCVAKDGRLCPRDRLLEVNGTCLSNLTFSRAVEVLREAACAKFLHLRVQPYRSEMEMVLPPPPLDECTISSHEKIDTPERINEEFVSNLSAVADAVHSQLALKKTCAVQNSLLPSPSSKSQLTLPVASSTKTSETAPASPAWDTMTIELVKGVDGLGFSVTSCDGGTAAAGRPNTVYVKEILQQGAAISDGRLRSGDRLLRVDDFDVSEKLQSEVVSILRAVPVASIVRLLVARVPSTANGPLLSKMLNGFGAGGIPVSAGGVVDDRPQQRLILLNIALMDSTVGLGISIKGRLKEDSSQTDMGLFIKSIIAGGAADKDGRLRENDQLISINNEPLDTVPNTQAMHVLRRNMRTCSSGQVRLVVSRQRRERRYESERTPSTHTVNSLGSSGGQSVTVNAEVHVTPASPLASSSSAATTPAQRCCGVHNAADPQAQRDRETIKPSLPPPPPHHKHFHNPTFYATQVLESALRQGIHGTVLMQRFLYSPNLAASRFVPRSRSVDHLSLASSAEVTRRKERRDVKCIRSMTNLKQYLGENCPSVDQLFWNELVSQEELLARCGVKEDDRSCGELQICKNLAFSRKEVSCSSYDQSARKAFHSNSSMMKKAASMESFLSEGLSLAPQQLSAAATVSYSDNEIANITNDDSDVDENFDGDNTSCNVTCSRNPIAANYFMRSNGQSVVSASSQYVAMMSSANSSRRTPHSVEKTKFSIKKRIKGIFRLRNYQVKNFVATSISDVSGESSLRFNGVIADDACRVRPVMERASAAYSNGYHTSAEPRGLMRSDRNGVVETHDVKTSLSSRTLSLFTASNNLKQHIKMPSGAVNHSYVERDSDNLKLNCKSNTSVVGSGSQSTSFVVLRSANSIPSSVLDINAAMGPLNNIHSSSQSSHMTISRYVV